jgi:hypothetical protein
MIFIGAAIVEAETMMDVTREARRRRISPEDSSPRNIPVRIPEDKLPPADYRNRLLTKEDVQKIWPEVL